MKEKRAEEAGACGFVLKHCAPEELVLAVRAALLGQCFITPALAAKLVNDKKGDVAADPMTALTPRQCEILRLAATGRSAKQIDAELGISTRTVEFHKYQLMETLRLRTSAELVHFAIRHGIVEPQAGGHAIAGHRVERRSAQRHDLQPRSAAAREQHRGRPHLRRGGARRHFAQGD